MDDGELEFAKKLVGTWLKDRYRIDGVLGIGGMGVVYRGAHRNGNKVAIKTLHAHLSMRNDIRARFLKEGYTANAVDHEGVVRVLDDDTTDDGTAFLVMDLLVGETVDGWWERSGKRLPPADVVELTCQLLDVLHAAHAKGIVHRDLKPENLFMTKGGVLKVLDFGIARVQDDVNSHAKTRTGTLLGTPAFMPPEQALGRVSDIDGRTDLWATGATMFTLLSGQFVHAADNADMMRIMAATQPARPLASVAPDVPAALAAVVDRALASDMQARWPDAKAMKAALESTRVGAPRPVLPASPTPFSSFEVDRTELGPAAHVPSSPGKTAQLVAPATAAPATAAPATATPATATPPIRGASTTAGTAQVVSTPTTPAPARGKGPMLAVAALALLGGIGLAAYFGASVAGRAHPDSATGAAAGLVPTDVAHAPGPEAASPPLPVAATSTLGSASASPSTSATPASDPTHALVAAAPRDAAKPPRRGAIPAPPASSAALTPPPAVAPASAAAKVDCKVPYTFDAEGHKHFKPECN